MLLTEDEANRYSVASSNLCPLIIPLLTQSSLCVMSLFSNNDQKKEKNCKIQIETNATLTMAYSFNNGNWIVQSLKITKFYCVMY